MTNSEQGTPPAIVAEWLWTEHGQVEDVAVDKCHEDGQREDEAQRTKVDNEWQQTARRVSQVAQDERHVVDYFACYIIANCAKLR